MMIKLMIMEQGSKKYLCTKFVLLYQLKIFRTKHSLKIDQAKTQTERSNYTFDNDH